MSLYVFYFYVLSVLIMRNREKKVLTVADMFHNKSQVLGNCSQVQKACGQAMRKYMSGNQNKLLKLEHWHMP